MEKLSMCRICLSDDILMRSIVRTPLQEVYESLTTMPFVAEDIRPVVVCTLCCARLANSLELKLECLQSEKLFTELLQSNVQVNLQVMPNVHLSTEGVIQMTPNVLGYDEVKQENAEGSEEDPLKGDDDVQSSDSKDNTSVVVVKEERNDVTGNDAAVEQDDADPYHSALGLHTECDIPMDIVKEEPDDLDTGAPRLAAQKCRNDTLLNNLKRTDQTMDKVEERKRDTRKEIEDTPVEKSNIVETGDNIDIRLHHEASSTIISIFTHTGAKPYQCNVCQKCFSKKRYLDQHVRIHTGEKPYECVVCKKCYNSKGNLNVHMRLHTGGEPYKCNVCKKCFRYKSSINAHMRTHVG